MSAPPRTAEETQRIISRSAQKCASATDRVIPVATVESPGRRHEYVVTFAADQDSARRSERVIANAAVRNMLQDVAHTNGLPLRLPAPDFCVDNAAMIAVLGVAQLAAGRVQGLDLQAKARMPLGVQD